MAAVTGRESEELFAKAAVYYPLKADLVVAKALDSGFGYGGVGKVVEELRRVVEKITEEAGIDVVDVDLVGLADAYDVLVVELQLAAYVAVDGGGRKRLVEETCEHRGLLVNRIWGMASYLPGCT